MPWRIQELPEAELKLHRNDDPSFGRRYQVFHRQICVGTLEVSPWLDYSSEQPDVHTEFKLDWVRLLPMGTLRDFLDGIAIHTANPDPRSLEYLAVRHDFDVNLLGVLWQTQQISKFPEELKDYDYGELSFSFTGTASAISNDGQS